MFPTWIFEDGKVCGAPICGCVECDCLKGAPRYLSAFEEDKRDWAFATLGPHPSLYNFAVTLMRATGTDLLSEEWRIALASRGIAIYYDLARTSVSYNATLYEGAHWNERVVAVPMVQHPRCCTRTHMFTPLDEGYCYLALYPRAMWFDLAKQLGPWPPLSALPAGRYPAVVAPVAKKVVGAMLLHCERSADGVDYLAGYPVTACVGGGSSDVLCRAVAGNESVDYCGSCTSPPDFTMEPCETPPCDCLGSHSQFGTDVLREFYITRPIVGKAGLIGNFLLLRDGVKDEWQASGSYEPVQLVEDGFTVVPHHAAGDGMHLVSVAGRHWILQFPGHTVLRIGPYVVRCSQNTALMGKGMARVECLVPPGGHVLARGLTEYARAYYLHQCLSTDPTDVTSRFTTRLDCPLYYASSIYRVPCRDTPVPVWSVPEDRTGAVMSGRFPPGHYWCKLDPFGVVLRTTVGCLFVGDLVVEPGGSVCLVRSRLEDLNCSLSFVVSHGGVAQLPGDWALGAAMLHLQQAKEARDISGGVMALRYPISVLLSIVGKEAAFAEPVVDDASVTHSYGSEY